MKPQHALLVGIGIAALAVIIPWVYSFGALPVSERPADWAAFGDYIGGILSPLISAIALAALVYTIGQQQSEIEQLKTEAAKADLVRSIEKLEADFERALTRYPIRLEVPGKVIEYSGLDVVMSPSFQEYRQALVSSKDVEKLFAQHEKLSRDHSTLVAYEMFGLAAGHLNQIRLYAETLEQRTNSNVISRYYRRKYSIAYQRFLECGILTTPWVEKP